MKIELIVFSGRRNPCWRLATEEVPALQAMLRKLPRHAGPLEIPERLGYSGFVVSNEDQSQPWTEVVVFHEFVAVHFKSRTDYLIDDNRIVENMLLETARPHVKDAVIESIRAEPQATGAS